MLVVVLAARPTRGFLNTEEIRRGAGQKGVVGLVLISHPVSRLPGDALASSAIHHQLTARSQLIATSIRCTR